jgi:hypothetical protein
VNGPALAVTVSLIVMLIAPAAARGQALGRLAWTVCDQAGSVLAGVTLTIRGDENRDSQTNPAGRFDFPDLPPGDYELTTTLRGFDSAHRRINFRTGETVSVSLAMVVAVLEQTVVTASKVGAGDTQSIPMAVSVVSGDLEG